MDIKQVEHYLKQTSFTNPFEYSFMYEGIPDNIGDICNLVNRQLIHPAKLHEYPEVKPNENEIWNNEPKTVQEMLKRLYEKNNEGIIYNKAPKDRVVVTCRGITLLLTSILRYKGIPARARAGFVPYITNNGLNIDHWICECWDKTQNKWILLDADFLMIDFAKTEFYYSANVYLDAIENRINPLNYGWDECWGMCYIISYINIDLLNVIYEEPWYNPRTSLTESLNWEQESSFLSATKNLSNKNVDLVRELAELLIDPDLNYKALKELLTENEQLMPIK